MPRISVEGTIGLILEITLAILDHLHVRDPLMVWGLFFLGLALISDSILRSDWARKHPNPRSRLKRRILGMTAVLVLFTAFGLWIDRNREEKTHPDITVLGYEVILFKPGTNNPFANVFVQNVGDEGTMSVYSSAGLALPTGNPHEVKKDLEAATRKEVQEGGGLVFAIGREEKKWFTVWGPPLSAQNSQMLKDGKLYFYFSGTIVMDRGNGKAHSRDFCGFIVGNKPNVILQCPEN